MSGNSFSDGSQSSGFYYGGNGGRGDSETGTSGTPNGSQLLNTFVVGGGVDLDHTGGGFHAIGNALVGGNNVGSRQTLPREAIRFLNKRGFEAPPLQGVATHQAKIQWSLTFPVFIGYDQVIAFTGGTQPAQPDTRPHLQMNRQAEVVGESQTYQEATQHRHETYALPDHANNVQLGEKHPVVLQLGEHSKVACRPIEGVLKFDVTIGYASLIEALNDLVNPNDAGARAAQDAIATIEAAMKYLKNEYDATQRTRAITALLYRTEVQNMTNATLSQTAAAKELITDFEEQTILCNITLKRFKELCERMNDVLGYREMYHQNAIRDKDMLEKALVGLGLLGLSDLEEKMGMGGLF
ncbi:hypothetical protein HYALB_00007102 [Hymenoscyphus albidus]|uniref:Uncharacterized protein n=1 Tax=Hymenoscyphus albidus TaxID=595503 RepID=A0A9N9Q1G8_9HELO|nr:hypothetical protein HYALB_00007102 [Hymenoscyphus albidus]